MANSLVAIVDASLRLNLRPDETRPILGGSIDVGKGKFNDLDTAYYYSFIASFFIAWLSAIILLSYYSKAIGKFKYWLISSLPLLFFLGQFILPLLESSILWINHDTFLLTRIDIIIETVGKPLSGLMLAIVFWSMAKVIKKSNPNIGRYLWLSGLGLLLLFTANQVTLMDLAPYPPFGMATITVFGFASYFILNGIYTSSAAIARNLVLREEIRKLASSKLLDTFANAELEAQLETEIARVVEKESIQESDKTIDMPSDEDIKRYTEEILEEIKRQRKN